MLVDYFKRLNLPNLTVVSPDAAAWNGPGFLPRKWTRPWPSLTNGVSEMNVAEIMNVIGDVNGRTCLVIDDLIDTAGTLVKTAAALMENGASQVYACASHPVFQGRRWRTFRSLALLK